MNDNIKAGSDIHAGDGGYSIGTKEKYDEFVKGRNQSLAKGRLEGLWWKARIGSVNNHQNPEVLEKFALLIVQDNIQTLRGNGYDDAAQVLQDIHFGIEDPV